MPRATVNAHFVLNLLFSRRRGCQPRAGGSPHCLLCKLTGMSLEPSLPLHQPPATGTSAHATPCPVSRRAEHQLPVNIGPCMAGRRQDHLTHRPRALEMLSGRQKASPCPLSSSRTHESGVKLLSASPTPRKLGKALLPSLRLFPHVLLPLLAEAWVWEAGGPTGVPLCSSFSGWDSSKKGMFQHSKERPA